MRREKDRAGIGVRFENALPAGARLGGIMIGEKGQIGPREKNRVMKQVAGEYRPVSAAFRMNAQTAWRVSCRLLQPNTIADFPVYTSAVVNRLRESGLYDRQYTIVIGFA